MKYYDIGVNQAANKSYLTFFLAPILLVIFLLIIFISFYIVRRYDKHQFIIISVGVSLMVFIGILVFIIHYNLYLYYPSERQKDMVKFLDYYLSQYQNIK